MSAALERARVCYAGRDRARVLTDSGEAAAEIAGALWYRGETVVTGDWVEVRRINDQEVLIETVLPRRTQFSRRAAGEREVEQVLAANIDVVFLVMGLDGDFNLRRLERYLTLAWESGAQPVVVLNKADLCADLQERLAQTRAVAREVPVITATAAAGAIDAVREWIAPGVTVALLGSSGVGKSTIANALMGEEHLRTNAVREHDSRGRHTTTHRELIPLPGGAAIIDTPGMRELQLWAAAESVDRTFDEIGELAVQCRFSNCGHTTEPGCAVAAALAEGRLDPARWESYSKLRREAARHEKLADPRAGQAEKRWHKSIAKSLKQHYKLTGRDAP